MNRRLRHLLRSGPAACQALLALLLGGLPSMASAQGRWAVCADEGQVCRFAGEGLVRYGVPGQWAFRHGRNRLLCDPEEFGDPAPGRRKQCEVSLNWRDDEAYRGWRDPEPNRGSGWRFCAVENEACHLNGRATARFGAEGRYQVRPVNGTFRCDLATFGDPAPGVVKRCEVEVGRGWGEPGQGPEEAGLARWQPCAPEGGSCRLGGPAILRYGVDGRWVYREASGVFACNNDSFGVDPAEGRGKQCQMIRLSR